MSIIWRERSVGCVAVAAALCLFALLSASSASASAAPPLIEGESATGITAHDAVLEATIDTNGLDTTFQFILESGCGVTGAAPSGGASCLSIGLTPVPSGQIAASSGPSSVSVDPNELGVTLRPETLYRYSVEASSSAGSTRYAGHEAGPSGEVPFQTFTTLPGEEPSPGGPPSIVGVSLSHLTATDATLEATINTGGLETDFEFQLWVSPCSHDGAGCEVIVPIPLPAGALLGSHVDQDVSLDLNSAGVTLRPGAEYGYSATASNALGSATSQWHGFSPPEETSGVAAGGDLPHGAAGAEATAGSPLAAQSGPSDSAGRHASSHRHRARRKHRRHSHRPR